MTIWTDLTGIAFCLDYVDAGGISTRALRAGPPEGQDVIFLHGTSGHLEAFSRNIVPHVEAGFHARGEPPAEPGQLLGRDARGEEHVGLSLRVCSRT